MCGQSTDYPRVWKLLSQYIEDHPQGEPSPEPSVFRLERRRLPYRLSAEDFVNEFAEVSEADI